MMEEMLKQILLKLDQVDGEVKATRAEMNNHFAQLNSKIDSYHAENISADEKLLEGIRATNNRIDNLSMDVSGTRDQIRYVNRRVADVELEFQAIKPQQ